MAKAVDLWKQFEHRISDECTAHGITCIKIPETLVFLPKLGKTIRKKSAPDFFISLGGIACLIDAKSTFEKSFSIKRNILREDKSSNKIHQWRQLEDASRRGNIAGYLIWFHQHRTITWASVPAIQELIARGDTGITPSSLGVVSWSDSIPANLKQALHEDVLAVKQRLMGLN